METMFKSADSSRNTFADRSMIFIRIYVSLTKSVIQFPKSQPKTIQKTEHKLKYTQMFAIKMLTN